MNKLTLILRSYLSHNPVLQTMSNLPMFVTNFKFLLLCSGLGLKQNKYCQLSPDCNIETLSISFVYTVHHQPEDILPEQ